MKLKWIFFYKWLKIMIAHSIYIHKYWKIFKRLWNFLSGKSYFIRINTLSGKFRHLCVWFRFEQGQDWYQPLHAAYFSFEWISMHLLLADGMSLAFSEAPFGNLLWMTLDRFRSQYWRIFWFRTLRAEFIWLTNEESGRSLQTSRHQFSRILSNCP